MIAQQLQPSQPRRARWTRLYLGIFALVAACGGDDGLPTKTVGQSIITPSVQLVILDNPGGGFTPAPPAGSTCLVGGRKFTLTLASAQLAYTKCIGDGVMPYREMSGSRTLTDPELKDLTTQLGKLTVVKGDNGCIADAPMLSVTVKTGTAEQQYVDDGFNCQVKDKPFLSRNIVTETFSKFDTYAK